MTARITPHRCGRPAKHGGSCMTPVAVDGGVCASHRPATAVHATPAPVEDQVSAFVAAYECWGCDADVQLFSAGSQQLIVVGHAADCPQLAEHVQRRSA